MSWVQTSLKATKAIWGKLVSNLKTVLQLFLEIQCLLVLSWGSLKFIWSVIYLFFIRELLEHEVITLLRAERTASSEPICSKSFHFKVPMIAWSPDLRQTLCFDLEILSNQKIYHTFCQLFQRLTSFVFNKLATPRCKGRCNKTLRVVSAFQRTLHMHSLSIQRALQHSSCPRLTAKASPRSLNLTYQCFPRFVIARPASDLKMLPTDRLFSIVPFNIATEDL